MTKRMILMLLGVLLLVAALAGGFYLHIQKLIASSPKPGAQTVTAIKLAAQDWQPRITAVGSLVPVRGVEVTTEIAGQVRSVEFKSGQDVAQGQVLVQLNADAERAQWQAAQAAAELAELTLKRDKAQLAAQAISQAQVDNETADLKAKQAVVAQAQATLDKKTIRAPFAGKLGITTVIPGQYLNPGDKLVTLQAIHPIYVDFFLPQQNLARLSVGLPVTLSTDAFAGQTFTGKISAVNPKVDTATRNVQVQATIDNARRQLLPGMFANVNVDVGTKGRFLTLPQTAITYNPYGATVFVLKPAEKRDDKASDKSTDKGSDKGDGQLVAQQVFVTTGEVRGDQVAILKGLSEGQDVVTSGQLKLKNGTPVKIDNTVQPANEAQPKPQEK